MTLLVGLLSLVSALLAPVHSSDCEATDIPKTAELMGQANGTASYDAEVVFDAGQTVYIEVRNGNLLGAALKIRISAGSTHPTKHSESLSCVSHVALPPGVGSVVRVKAQLFAETPTKYIATVSVGEGTDAAVFGLRAYSGPYSSAAGTWQIPFRFLSNSKRPKGEAGTLVSCSLRQ